ncbi:MAG: AlpA family phage regulatory protein [Pseudomonadota bacterium]
MLRLPDVEAQTGLKKSQIYALMREGDFPSPVAISQRSRGWPSSEIAEWIEARKEARIAA